MVPSFRRKPACLMLFVLLALPGFLPAASPVSAEPKGVPQLLDLGGDTSETCPPPAPTNISYFGGTTWDAVDGRWEAIPNSVWTFDSGVGSDFAPAPYKQAGLHGHMEGWEGLDLSGGTGGDWSNLMILSDLPPGLNECGTCAIQDSVLVFLDLNAGGHGTSQDNLALSPWIDLQAAGMTGYPGKFIELDVYAELSILDYVFIQVAVDYAPDTNPASCGAPLSHPVVDLPRLYTQGAFCTQPGSPLRMDVSHLIPPSSPQIRVGVGVVNLCSFYANCTGVTNYTPVFDNIRVGVYGDPQLPALATFPVDRPQDAFPQNGNLDWSSPGRVDCAFVNTGLTPKQQPATGTGDTLVVRGGFDSTEVRVNFAVRPGPYIAPGGPGYSDYVSLISRFTSEGSRYGLSWYSARMDTAEKGGCPVPGVWMTAYHEEDTHFQGAPDNDTQLDPNDPDPQGHQTRLLNDMFTDDLFTPGSRLMIFYSAHKIGSGVWTTVPDTTGGCFYEMEILPSSMTSAGTFNSVLYVDDADGFGAQPLIEQGLAAVLPGGSANFEGTAWDRFDVGASSSGNVSLGRPSFSQYGASIPQVAGYHTVVFNSGDLPWFTLVKSDAVVFNSALAQGLNLYVSGDNIAWELSHGTYPFLDPDLGVNGSGSTNSFRWYGFMGPDYTNCVALIPVGTAAGAHFDGNDGTAAASGNGCPLVRSFDVLGVTADSAAAGNEAYFTAQSDTVFYHSVSFDPGAYRTVIDGGSLHERRDTTTCVSTAPIEDRLCRVFGWFGTPGAVNCVTGDTTATVSGAKFHDLNGDGIHDPGDPPLSGVQIRVTSGTGVVAGTAVTDANGNYTISGIPSGPDYWVTETVPAGMVQTAPSVVTYRMPLTAGQVVTGLDFGNRDSCQAQNYAVFTAGVDDTFSLANGQEWFYPGPNGLRSFCYPGRPEPDSVEADVCNPDSCVGHTFSNLVPPDCHIQAATLTVRLKACSGQPDNDSFSFIEAGQQPAWGDSISALRHILNGEPKTWNQGETTLLVLDLANLPPSIWNVTNVLGALQDGELNVFIQDDTAVDFMKLEIQFCCDDTTATVSGAKFHDLNGDGIHDPGDPPLSGVQIRVTSGTGVVAGTTVTDANGNYTISGIPPGPDYWVTETVPAGMVQTAPSVVTYRMPLTAGQVVTGLDFGNRDSCEAQSYAVFTAGVDDTFSLANGQEWFYPGPNGLRSFCYGGGTQPDSVEADVCNQNACIGHTFGNLVPPGCHIQAATLTVRLKACGGQPDNDSFSFIEAGQQPAWGDSISALRHILNGEPKTWNQDDTTLLVLDLANLPPSIWNVTNVLGALQDGELNVFIQDDTGVDFMKLEIEYCCDGGIFPCVTPPRGMAGWWPGDDASPAPDLVKPHLDGVLNGDAGYATGMVGSAFVFDGDGDYVAVPSGAKIQSKTQLSVDCWVLTTDTRSGPRTILRKSQGGASRGFWIYLDGGYLSLQYGDGLSPDGGTTTNMIADGTWHHVAFTVSHGWFAFLYLDGNIVFGGPGLTLWFDNTDPLYIGGGLGFDLAGRIDEVEYFHRQLNQAEVQSLVDAGIGGKCRENQYLAGVSRGYPGDAVFVSPVILNDTPVSRDYNWEVVPLPAGGPCTVPGPGQFVPASGTVTVPPGMAVPVGSIAITPPAGMLQDDQACYAFRASHADDPNHTIVLSAQGALRKPRPGWRIHADHDATAGLVLPQFPDPATSEWDTVEVRFTVENTADLSGQFDYRLHIEDAYPDTVSDEIAFLNLAPGDTISGSLGVPVGQTGTVSAMIRVPAWEPFRPRRIILSQNAPDEGGYVPVGEAGLLNWEIYAGVVGADGPGGGTEPAGLRFRAGPNPFRATVNVAFSLDRSGPVDLRVYDVAGRLVRRIHEGELGAGPWQFVWDARSDTGHGVGSGIYFIRLKTQAETAVRKVLLLH